MWTAVYSYNKILQKLSCHLLNENQDGRQMFDHSNCSCAYTLSLIWNLRNKWKQKPLKIVLGFKCNQNI